MPLPNYPNMPNCPANHAHAHSYSHSHPHAHSHTPNHTHSHPHVQSHSHCSTDTVIGISSGAAQKAYDGWLSYCITKAAFKQMISCYALENTQTHFASVSPGPVKTKMQETLRGVDYNKFESLI